MPLPSEFKFDPEAIETAWDGVGPDGIPRENLVSLPRSRSQRNKRPLVDFFGSTSMARLQQIREERQQQLRTWNQNQATFPYGVIQPRPRLRFTDTTVRSFDPHLPSNQSVFGPPVHIEEDDSTLEAKQMKFIAGRIVQEMTTQHDKNWLLTDLELMNLLNNALQKYLDVKPYHFIKEQLLRACTNTLNFLISRAERNGLSGSSQEQFLAIDPHVRFRALTEEAQKPLDGRPFDWGEFSEAYVAREPLRALVPGLNNSLDFAYSPEILQIWRKIRHVIEALLDFEAQKQLMSGPP